MKKHEILLALIESKLDEIETGELQTGDNENMVIILNEILIDYEIEKEQLAMKK